MMKILAIETSCDETAAAVVKDGQEILSNIVATQTEFHKKYGGIVPEIASRKHIEVINPIIKEAMEKAKTRFQDLDAVAVTYGPGLVGSLIVGISAAKAIAYALDIPLIGVNHLEAHIYANFISSPLHPSPSSMERGMNSPPKAEKKGVRFPFVCLIVSGGHTIIVLVKDHGKYQVLGRTRDDAAGEAFDKVARFLNLGYPGGPIIDKLAKEGNPKAINFKRPMIEDEFGYDFSFSGIKTALVNFVHRSSSLVYRIPDLVASFQQAIVDVLVDKTIRAAKEYNCKTIALAGGVSANSLLREQLKNKGEGEELRVTIPPLEYCTDNAAMVGCAGCHHLKQGRISDFRLAAVANLRL